MNFAVILPAAGSGQRMGGGTPKQFLLLGGMPLLVRSMRPFLLLPDALSLVVAAPPSLVDFTRLLLKEYLGSDSRWQVVAGGTSRQDSVRAALAALPAGIPLVLVHDGARPLLRQELLQACLAAARRDGAAIAAVPLADTLKSSTPEQHIRATIPRDGLWRAQTPQVMRRDWLEQAFVRAEEDGFQGTDEASLLEHAGLPVTLVTSDETNIKITRTEDLSLAAALLRGREQTHSSNGGLRIGHGYDAHRLVAGRPLVLGGMTIAHPLGLDGHSDADVLLHALMDALLGGLGLGDIGRHFPDSDPSLRGADSLLLLARVMARMHHAGARLLHADVTLICQAPRLAPHIPAMRERIAAVCGTAAAQINIKATTTEHMGFCGRGEGIAAHAVVLLTLDPAREPLP